MAPYGGVRRLPPEPHRVDPQLDRALRARGDTAEPRAAVSMRGVKVPPATHSINAAKSLPGGARATASGIGGDGWACESKYKDKMTAKTTAAHLVKYIMRAGFVMMKEPPASLHGSEGLRIR